MPPWPASLLHRSPYRRTALASPRPRNGGLGSIKHVVMLMQENRSFDHYYGTLSGVRGFSDPTAMRTSNYRSVLFQPDPSNPDGFLLPYRLDSKITAAQAIPSMSHEWDVQHQAWNGGAMDNWVPAHMASDGKYTMDYFSRDDIPFQFALAESGADGDHHCHPGSRQPRADAHQVRRRSEHARPTCLASALGARLGSSDGDAGTIDQTVLLTNRSSKTCVPYGFPGVLGGDPRRWPDWRSWHQKPCFACGLGSSPPR